MGAHIYHVYTTYKVKGNMPVLWVEAFVWFEEDCIWADGTWEIAQCGQEKGNQTI